MRVAEDRAIGEAYVQQWTVVMMMMMMMIFVTIISMMLGKLLRLSTESIIYHVVRHTAFSCSEKRVV
jgi:hypothetical protein